jgi:plasmid replication initiation protein
MSAFTKILNRLVIRLAKWTDSSLVQIIETPNENNKSKEIINEQKSIIDVLSVPSDIENGEKKGKENKIKKKASRDLTKLSFDPRDMVEIMEYPYLSLSKNRTSPIYYERETSKGTIKIRVSCHPPHYVASIYDWDIIMFVESKIQEIMNSGSDIPPRTIIVPRYELLKHLHKHNGKKEEKDLHASLTRLKTTVIETSVRNEDRKYDCFGWLDSWGYTDRKDIKEIRITISQWLYDGICRKGALLKIRPEYFDITSGIKKFLYRIARKHAGTQNETWNMPLEVLYQKSGSEQEFKKFKYDIKKAVMDNDIPEYFLQWVENEDKKISVRFINKKKELIKMLP